LAYRSFEPHFLRNPNGISHFSPFNLTFNLSFTSKINPKEEYQKNVKYEVKGTLMIDESLFQELFQHKF